MLVCSGFGVLVTLGFGVIVSVGVGLDELLGVTVDGALGIGNAVLLGSSVDCAPFTIIVHFFISKFPSSSTDVDTQYTSVLPNLCASISPSSETVAISLSNEYHKT